MSDFNTNIIDEFRANGGRVGGPFEGAPMLLLHHTGRKTGTVRVSPVVYRREGDAYVVFGSKAGAPEHPDWFRNLEANPQAEIEVGTETIPVNVRVAEGEERDRIWSAQKADMPGFADYEQKTTREIPVVILEPR
jgi:deazaflavin-dependent oxidoreductase (nitroreductase family)